MNSDLTWSQTACLSLSFPTCKVRQLAESSPNTESNSNSTVSPCVVYGPIQKNNSKDSASQRCEERSLPEPLVILLHDYQNHHHTAGDVPGPPLRLSGSDPRAQSPVTKTAGWAVALVFSFILTEKNELHHTLHLTWEALRNVEFRMILNIILAGLVVILLNKHILLKTLLSPRLYNPMSHDSHTHHLCAMERTSL